MAYSECFPTRLNLLAERTCFSQVVAIIGKPEAEQSHRTMLARLYWDPAKRFTLLHLAAVQNAVPFAQLLLREGALPNAQACRRPPPSLSPHDSIANLE